MIVILKFLLRACDSKWRHFPTKTRSHSNVTIMAIILTYNGHALFMPREN